MAAQAEARTVLGALIARENLSWDEAARKVSDASKALEPARSTSITGRHLARLARRERGEGRPAPVTCRALQHAFGRPVDELLAEFDPAALTLDSRVAGQATSEVLTVAADRARRFVTQLQTTSDDTLDLMYEEVRDLAQAYPTRPLTEILGHLVSGQDAMFTLLERPQRPEHSRRLYFLAAVVGGMLAKASHDLGDPQAALTQSRTAWLCADQADHHGVRAWVSGLQSLVSFWARRPQEAIRYAQRGAQYADTARSTASIWLAANEGRAWAALGNAAKAQEAIERADAAWARVEPDDLDELGGIATFSRPRQLYYAADAMALMPAAADQALSYSTEAVAAYADPFDPDWAFGDAAGSRCDLAVARLYGGDVDGAREAMSPVLDLVPEQRINGIITSVNRVQTALTPLGAAAGASDLQGEIEAFTRVPIKSLPR